MRVKIIIIGILLIQKETLCPRNVIRGPVLNPYLILQALKDGTGK